MPKAHSLGRPSVSAGFRFGALALGLWLALTGFGLAQNALPVPRFVSIHAPKVNVRTGPGARYPVDWVLVRKSMPVEIVAEFEHWRKIRDWQGTEGWVHQNMLSGNRTAVVMNEIRALRRNANDASPIVAKVEPGVIGRVLSCEDAWCRLEISGFRGYMKRTEIWGVLDDERFE